MGVVAPKGLVVLLILASAIGLFVPGTIDRLRSAVPWDVLLTLGVFLVLAVASSFWAPDPTRAIHVALKVTALCLGGLVAVESVAALGARHPRRFEAALVGGLVLGAAILLVAVVYAKVTGESLWGEHRSDPLTTLSPGQPPLLLLALLVAAMLWKRRARTPAALVLGATVAAFALLSNASVLVGSVAGLVAFGLSWVMGRRALILLAVWAAGLVLAAPGVVRLLPSGDEMFQKVGFVVPSAVHRVYMWHFVVARIVEHPLRGWGLASSRDIPGGDEIVRPAGPEVIIGSGEDARPKPLLTRRGELIPHRSGTLLMQNSEYLPLHPHNTALQLWLELGLPGALLMAWTVSVLYLRRPPADAGAFASALRAGLVSTYLVIGALSYGAWQTWWIALGWMIAALAAGVMTARARGDPGTTGTWPPARR